MPGLRLSEIWIYPVKSLGGVRVEKARVLEKGLQHDRRWMLIDENGKFLSQRSHPMMSLFKIRNNETGFEISFQGEVLELKTEPAAGAERTAVIWDDTVSVVEAATGYHRWFSDRLHFDCRLVSFPESNPRLIDPDYRLAGESVSLADGYPMLIIGQASLDDLNGRLNEPVPMNRFRPNFVFTGGTPYEEEKWHEFKIGQNAFVGVKPCARCQVTTVDQQTAMVGKEPLLALSKYRRWNGNIYFGLNVIPVDLNEVHESDEIRLG